MTLPNRNLQIAYTLYALFFYILFCLSIICFCYNRVSRFIRQHNANTVSLATQEINLTRALFVLIFAFAILWVPSYISIVFYRMILPASRCPRQMGLAIPYLNYLSCAINPLVYGVMRPLVRNKMKRMFFGARPLPRVSPEAPTQLHRVHGTREEEHLKNTASTLKHDGLEQIPEDIPCAVSCESLCSFLWI